MRPILNTGPKPVVSFAPLQMYVVHFGDFCVVVFFKCCKHRKSHLYKLMLRNKQNLAFINVAVHFRILCSLG